MTYSEQEILRRLRLGEDSGWAFKQVEFSGDRPTSPRRDDWANEIAAFANANGGALLCGVSSLFILFWGKSCASPTRKAERLWYGSSTSSGAPRWWRTGRSTGQRVGLDCRYAFWRISAAVDDSVPGRLLWADTGACRGVRQRSNHPCFSPKSGESVRWFCHNFTVFDQ